MDKSHNFVMKVNEETFPDWWGGSEGFTIYLEMRYVERTGLEKKR